MLTETPLYVTCLYMSFTIWKSGLAVKGKVGIKLRLAKGSKASSLRQSGSWLKGNSYCTKPDQGDSEFKGKRCGAQCL